MNPSPQEIERAKEALKELNGLGELSNNEFNIILTLLSSYQKLEADYNEAKEIIKEFVKKNDFMGLLNSHFYRKDVHTQEMKAKEKEISTLRSKLKEATEALRKIASYQMPHMQIKEVSIEAMTDLTHCIQDMAGEANKALYPCCFNSGGVEKCPIHGTGEEGR